MTDDVRTDRRSQAAPDDEPGVGFLTPRFREGRLPWPQIAGYLGSVVLTLAALFAVLGHVLPPAALLAAILGLAVLQAGLQLGAFMHLWESRGPAWQVTFLGLAFFTAIGMVGASIWIMAFKWGAV